MDPRTPFIAGLLAAAACGVSSTAIAATSEPAPPDASTAPGGVLFEDPFDDDSNGWGIIDDPDYGTAAYDGGDYVWNFTGRVAHLLPEVLAVQYDNGQLDMLDVVVRAEATIVSGDGVAGVFCRENPDADADFQWYEFVARDGFAAIRIADLEGNLDVLAETDDVSLPVGEPIAFEASCIDDVDGQAELSLSLNGEEVLTATDDDPLENGVTGIGLWTFPAHERMEVRWHDFSVSRPPGA